MNVASRECGTEQVRWRPACLPLPGSGLSASRRAIIRWPSMLPPSFSAERFATPVPRQVVMPSTISLDNRAKTKKISGFARPSVVTRPRHSRVRAKGRALTLGLCLWIDTQREESGMKTARPRREPESQVVGRRAWVSPIPAQLRSGVARLCHAGSSLLLPSSRRLSTLVGSGRRPVSSASLGRRLHRHARVPPQLRPYHPNLNHTCAPKSTYLQATCRLTRLATGRQRPSRRESTVIKRLQPRGQLWSSSLARRRSLPLLAARCEHRGHLADLKRLEIR
ncbi:hypothetical protein QBC47DRAFT_19230 [Echria macrotheca]|uniref:Uncharacterized protein n=1 Tax=Echria macrotheca TaxID=438768 RepID=A0AAJ0FHD3_9PEZI|nr:hypothetical protein QBC47DRAFT_19230 [Echria macrotheca]